MKAKPRAALCALLCCAVLSACTQWYHDLGESLADKELPPEGTPLAQVLEKLGPPVRMSASDLGYLLAWEYWHIKEDSLGVSLGALGADFLSADWGDMRIKGDFLLVTLDKNHRVTSATRSQWDNYGGGGQAIQPFFGFVSVVDSDDLTEPMPQHRWGGTLLQRRLPVALNSGSSPDTGQQGLQQRGTPRSMGQQSLEMD